MAVDQPSAKSAVAPAIGTIIGRRDEFDSVAEWITGRAEAGAWMLRIDAPEGAGLRTFFTAIAREARLAGFVPVSSGFCGEAGTLPAWPRRCGTRRGSSRPSRDHPRRVRAARAVAGRGRHRALPVAARHGLRPPARRRLQGPPVSGRAVDRAPTDAARPAPPKRTVGGHRRGEDGTGNRQGDTAIRRLARIVCRTREGAARHTRRGESPIGFPHPAPGPAPCGKPHRSRATRSRRHTVPASRPRPCWPGRAAWSNAGGTRPPSACSVAPSATSTAASG